MCGAWSVAIISIFPSIIPSKIQLLTELSFNFISKMINDIIINSKKNISRLKIKTNNDVFNQSNFLISMSDNMKIDSIKISKFLYKNVYNHPKLIKKRSNSENVILKLFEYFQKNFDQLPKDWLAKNNIQNKHRIICDYISGMTDRYASNLYNSLYG